MSKFTNKVRFFAYTLDCREIALLKITSICLGTLIGLGVAVRKKTIAAIIASFGFVAAALPLIDRFVAEYNTYDDEIFDEDYEEDEPEEMFDEECFETIG
ncbi:MAG: hypothetical protein IKU80_04830 [Firmicutes bacterium]|nr:hypothetical protein [Bacillota bacterium]